MKSAYELAMERLQKADPDAVQQLTDAQREELAAIEKKYQAKIAEKEVFLGGKIGAARGSDREALEEQLRREKARLNEEKETAKAKVRGSGN